MKKYKTIRKDSCFPTALGCLLHINPKTIPNFFSSKRKTSSEIAWKRANQWLIKHCGKAMAIFPAYNVWYSPFLEGYNIGIMDIVSVKNKDVSSETYGHAVVCNGNKIVYDPSDLKGKAKKRKVKYKFQQINHHIVLYDVLKK